MLLYVGSQIKEEKIMMKVMHFVVRVRHYMKSELEEFDMGEK